MTPKDIIQIDATILAGIMILLSLILTNPAALENIEKISEDNPLFDRFTKTPAAWVFPIGGMFSLSALFAILMHVEEKVHLENEKKGNSDSWYKICRLATLGFMAFGFLLFIAGFFISYQKIFLQE